MANLNADLLDGLNSTSFALSSERTGVIFGSPSDADGYIDTARCPTGTYATGGGGAALTVGEALTYSGPDFNPDYTLIPNSWFAGADRAPSPG